MKQLSKRTLALLLVIYIIVLGTHVYSESTYTGYSLVYQPVDTATIDLYFNIPPVLLSNISSMSWYRSYTYTGLDLAAYFNDTEGENLTYSFTGPVNIAVEINESVVTFVAVISSWTGSELVVFNATDNYGASTASNNITLTVSALPTGTPGGGAGGGGGGGTTYQKKDCIERWACTDWSTCKATGGTTGKQTRTCIDINDCKKKESKPSETQTCTIAVATKADTKEDSPIFAPIIKEVSHRPVLWVVIVLIGVFGIEAYIYLHQKRKRSAEMKKYYG